MASLHNENTFEIEILEVLENHNINSELDLDIFLKQQRVENTTQDLKKYIHYLLNQLEEVKETFDDIIAQKEEVELNLKSAKKLLVSIKDGIEATDFDLE